MTNANEQTPRFFEQVVLVSEDGKKTVIERRYSDGSIEYWSIMAINWKAGNAGGTAQVPFKIDVQAPESGGFNLREMAFARYESALAAAEGPAQAQIKEKVRRAHRQQESKILLANSLPPTPALQ